MGAFAFTDRRESLSGKLCLTGPLIPSVISLSPHLPDAFSANTTMFGQQNRSSSAVSAASDAAVNKEPSWHTPVLCFRLVYDKRLSVGASVQAFGHSFSPGCSSTTFLGIKSLRLTIAPSFSASFAQNISYLSPWAGLSGHVLQIAPYAIALGSLPLFHYAKRDVKGLNDWHKPFKLSRADIDENAHENLPQPRVADNSLLRLDLFLCRIHLADTCGVLKTPANDYKVTKLRKRYKRHDDVQSHSQRNLAGSVLLTQSDLSPWVGLSDLQNPRALALDSSNGDVCLQNSPLTPSPPPPPPQPVSFPTPSFFCIDRFLFTDI